MLTISDLRFSIAGRVLFDGASARIPAGHKVGLVGPNGAGKTTLFRLIRGELQPERGTIELPRRARVGGVDQEASASDRSLLETVLAADDERARLLAEAERATDPTRIAEIQTRLADIDAWSAEARAASILSGLGFTTEEQTRPTAEFSGGWRMRVALAGVLFSAPDILLLDEPTNYLDLEGALWLEGFLARYPHTALVISHDRALLNRAVRSILSLSGGRLELYAGGYDDFARARAARRSQLAAEAARQAERRAHLQRFVDRFRAKATKARQAQSRLKMLERMEAVEVPPENAAPSFAFPDIEPLSPPIVTLDGAAAGYGDRTVLSRLSLRIDPDDRIALLGRNGEGKSTLARLIAGRLGPTAGTVRRARGLRIGYFAQHQIEELEPAETPLQHLVRVLPDVPEASLRARLAGFGIDAGAATTEVGRLSGGQRARLSLLLASWHAPHLLILDEPTNHLDIESRDALIEALNAFPGAVILVSHDMHLLSLVADRLWLVSGGRVRPFEDDLEGYRRLLLSPSAPAGDGRTGAPASAKPARAETARPARERLLALRAEARKAEARVEKLLEMRARLDEMLADPDIYTPGRLAEAEKWQRKRAEVAEALERAEALWLEAMDALEQAGAAT